MQSIEVARIIGSEGRYDEFTRTFLPKRAHSRTRWVRLNVAAHVLRDVPPIRVYELGGVYFVRDGHHRVSVARHHGAVYIDAEVVSLDTYFHIDPHMRIEDLPPAVIEYERQRFISQTRIGDILPSFQPHFTAPGGYDALLSDIRCHERLLRDVRGTHPDHTETIHSWHTLVYLPIVQALEDAGMLKRFPGRTEADLYVWFLRHWSDLRRRSAPPGMREALRILSGPHSARRRRLRRNTGSTSTEIRTAEPRAQLRRDSDP